jgi:hypothetical protein
MLFALAETRVELATCHLPLATCLGPAAFFLGTHGRCGARIARGMCIAAEESGARPFFANQASRCAMAFTQLHPRATSDLSLKSGGVSRCSGLAWQRPQYPSSGCRGALAYTRTTDAKPCSLHSSIIVSSTMPLAAIPRQIRRARLVWKLHTIMMPSVFRKRR